MKPLVMNHVGQTRKRRIGEQAQARVIILALIFFLMGVAVSAWWFSGKPSAQAVSQTALSGQSKAVNASPQPQTAPPADPASLEAVKRLIPDVHSASLEKGARILREAALAEFQQTAREFQARQKKAEQDFILGQNNHSDEQQQMAMKQLKEIKAEQGEKLEQIAAKSKAQIETFRQLKSAAR